MAWHKGPLPPGTWDWGGLVTGDTGGGFLFADFRGDHAVTVPCGVVVRAEDVAWYDNDLKLPPAPPRTAEPATTPGE